MRTSLRARARVLAIFQIHNLVLSNRRNHHQHEFKILVRISSCPLNEYIKYVQNVFIRVRLYTLT
jgi:hypothetical protein